jgi:hypothetical protein
MFRKLRNGFSTTGELIRGLWNGPYWWLVPALLMLLPAAILLLVTQGMPLVAPFVYTLF